MYTCGPTVYRYAHLGNLRMFILADFIRRVLLNHGVNVRHVKNITDVGHMRDEHLDADGDRILVQAELEGRSPAELAAHYEAAFHDDELLVNILPAHAFPRATEHVAEMIQLAEQLEDAGYAYRAADGTLYYEVTSFAGYGMRRASAATRTSCFGSCPRRAGATSAGHRAGAPASPAGTSSARPCRGATWATRSTSTPAAWTTSSRTTRAREPRRRRWLVTFRPACGPVGAPAGRGSQDGQVGRQYPATVRPGRRRHRAAGAALPGPDRPLRSQDPCARGVVAQRSRGAGQPARPPASTRTAARGGVGVTRALACAPRRRAADGRGKGDGWPRRDS
ncbi:hypothetical protein BH23CHL7_BH23CHL7_11330 [soil metagenome]